MTPDEQLTFYKSIKELLEGEMTARQMKHMRRDILKIVGHEIKQIFKSEL